MRYFLLICAALLLTSPAFAQNYDVDYTNSSVTFSATHAGKEFTGTFNKWTATIEFDADNLAASSLKAVFSMADAKTGNAMFDGALPQADWFDVKTHGDAVFVSDTINKNADGSFHVDGKLTLKGITQPVGFDFTLSDTADNQVSAEGQFEIDRLEYDLGKKSDGKAEWVSPKIAVVIKLKATKTIP